MGVAGTEITWENFKKEFIKKYFPIDVSSKKYIEFLQLKQESMSVADYVAKFDKLVKFCSHYNDVEPKGSKCVKFGSNVCHEIMEFIDYQEICRFLMLVNKCRIYDEDNRVKSSQYNIGSEKKNGNQYRGKPYGNPADKGKQKFNQKDAGGKK